MQRTPAGLPAGMPGIGDEIDGAMQHAPQPTRQSIYPPLLLEILLTDLQLFLYRVSGIVENLLDLLERDFLGIISQVN
jgi:hypothetical protein